jgi:uncharacterized protein
MKMRITAAELKVDAELNESKTAKLVWDALPIEATGNRWGEEIYFAIPVRTGLEPGSRDVLSSGELGYWPTGHAFCIFFGPTPASRGDEIRAASAVNVIGNLLTDPRVFRSVKENTKIKLEKAVEAKARNELFADISS